ncbi:hypothetical protein SASC598J21_002890, partial [Snodgrassella alvi SCGC AB-598-J21]
MLSNGDWLIAHASTLLFLYYPAGAFW